MQLTAAKLSVLAALLGSTLAAPTQSTGRKVIKTTEHHGQLVDWILRESQGDIATPPPRSNSNAKSVNKILSTLEPGPEGAVPILRSSVKLPAKVGPRVANATEGSHAVKSRQYAGTHWYADANLQSNNNGGGATYNVWDTYVESSGDFSLMQIGCVHDNVPNKDRQTAEGGIMHYPQMYANGPFLFTYFTTDGYASSGDNVGGYNADQAGWVQYSSTNYPGMPLTSVSSFGGTQDEVGIEYYLYQGNWWFYFNSEPMGYYPGSVYSAGTDESQSLAAYATDVAFWGEVYNSENAETTTDMGSGNFPSAGQGQAAYIRNIFVIDTSDNTSNFADNGEVVSDTSRYQLATYYNSGSSWESYLYLGGPGAGGVVGG